MKAVQQKALLPFARILPAKVEEKPSKLYQELAQI
jgi:hypothetical protein